MSDFLFAAPGFLTGLGRTLDIGGVLRHYSYNFSWSPEDADLQAFHNDWRAVSNDLRQALELAKPR